MLRNSTLLLAALALCSSGGACKSSHKKSEQVASAEATAPTVAAALGQPIFEVDGVELAVQALSEDVELLSIKALPPIDDWATIIARSKDGREFQGGKPKLLTGTRTMKLVKLPEGYEFRVMDVKDTGPYVRHKMNAVARVIIYTNSYHPPEPPAPSLRMRNAAGESMLSDKLESIARTPEPGEEKARDTWLLGDLLKSGGGELTGGVRLENAAGDELPMSQAELVDPGWSHIIKRNRRGEFNYRGWKLGDKAAKERELRGVVLIEAL